jgi:hypothetical protein
MDHRVKPGGDECVGWAERSEAHAVRPREGVGTAHCAFAHPTLAEQVLARYGVEPRQVPDFIALRGDPSDKLPGARGVGPAGAATLIRRYGSLEAVLKVGRFPKQAAELRLYKSIATMDKKAPLPKLPDQTPTWAKATALARGWQLNALAARLDVLAGGDKARSVSERRRA